MNELHRRMLQRAGLSKHKLGRLLGVHRNTASRWKVLPGYAIAYLELRIEVNKLKSGVEQIVRSLGL